jgi:hypothetical protein
MRNLSLFMINQKEVLFMFKKFKWLIIAGIAVLLIAAIAIPVLAAGPVSNGGQVNGRGLGLGTGLSDSVAQLLGLTQEEIREQRIAGKSLVEIAASSSVSEADLVALIMKDKAAALKAMVAAGSLSQADADQRLTQIEDRVKLAVNRTLTGPPQWAIGTRGAGQAQGHGQALQNHAKRGNGNGQNQGAPPNRRGGITHQ